MMGQFHRQPYKFPPEKSHYGSCFLWSLLFQKQRVRAPMGPYQIDTDTAEN
jgi:hypothetical protein